MARPLRESVGGLIYHVLNRGSGRQTLFYDDDDYAAFLRVVDQVQERIAVPVVCFCLMPNHWHLVLRPEKSGQLSEFMRLLQVTHTQRHHAHRGTAGTGPLYQGRFKSFPMQDDDHALTVIRYVERNALRAGLCKRAQEWRWGSSHRHHAKGATKPGWLLEESQWPVEPGSDYLRWLNKPQTEKELEAIRLCVKRGRPYGSEPWTMQIAKRLGLESTLRPRGRPSAASKADGKGS